MHNHSSQKDPNNISPSAFVLELDSLMPSDLDLNVHESEPNLGSAQKVSLKEPARTDSREEKRRLAGARSRQKKKQYVEELQERVKGLEGEVEKYEAEISKCKDQLVEAIRSANSQTSQHAYTYHELEQQATSQDPDIDTINHLLDLIQSRIGANAKERQAKLDYNFKQITNSLFPAAHRYMMYCAQNHLDLFADNPDPAHLQHPTNGSWTQELYQKVKLDERQLQLHRRFKDGFRAKRQESIECIRRLRVIRDEMKKQEEVFERGISEFRCDLDPVQSALITVFGEKNKLRREFSMGDELSCEEPPQKRVKPDQ